MGPSFSSIQARSLHYILTGHVSDERQCKWRKGPQPAKKNPNRKGFVRLWLCGLPELERREKTNPSSRAMVTLRNITTHTNTNPLQDSGVRTVPTLNGSWGKIIIPTERNYSVVALAGIVRRVFARTLFWMPNAAFLVRFGWLVSWMVFILFLPGVSFIFQFYSSFPF